MKTVTCFVRSTPADLLKAAFADIRPDRTVELLIPGGANESVHWHGFGRRLHEAFDEANRGDWVAPQWYRYVRSLRQWLAGVGVQKIYTEWARSSSDLCGVADASVVGGPRRYGTIEIKAQGCSVVPNANDLAQLAAYCDLDATTGRPLARQWAALAYVLPRHGKIRLLIWEDVRPLVFPLIQLRKAF